MKEEPATAENESEVHWRRKALLPPLVFVAVSAGLILSGIFLSLTGSISLRAPSGWVPLILVMTGFLVLLYMVIGAGPTVERVGWPGEHEP